MPPFSGCYCVKRETYTKFRIHCRFTKKKSVIFIANFNFLFFTLYSNCRIQSAHKVGRTLESERGKVLVLGAGFVSGPVVDYLSRNSNANVTVGTALQEDMEKLMRLSSYVRPEIIDVQTQTDKLEHLINVNDLVIRLSPFNVFKEPILQFVVCL